MRFRQLSWIIEPYWCWGGVLAIAIALSIQPCSPALAALAGHAPIQPSTVAGEPQPTETSAGTFSTSASAEQAGHDFYCCESACILEVTSIRPAIRWEEALQPSIDEQITFLSSPIRLSATLAAIVIQPHAEYLVVFSPILHRITPLII